MSSVPVSPDREPRTVLIEAGYEASFPGPNKPTMDDDITAWMETSEYHLDAFVAHPNELLAQLVAQHGAGVVVECLVTLGVMEQSQPRYKGAPTEFRMVEQP